MLKPVLGVAAAGVVGLLLWKLFLVVLLPLMGVAIAAILGFIKIAFAAFMVLFAIWLFRRLSRNEVPSS